jgi:rSAM/selenodomain-associated transferase 1
MAPTDRIILLGKYPEPGAVKTRLIPVLGEQGAADLQKEMMEHVLCQMRKAAAKGEIELEVCYTGADEGAMRQLVGNDLKYRDQGQGDLGERLSRAFEGAFQNAVKRAVLVGSDCPTATAEVMLKGLDKLQDNDVVLGPASDGGYYLIGLKAPFKALFEDMPWSTSKVLELTKHRIAEKRASLFLLEEGGDVDVPEDLPVWEAVKRNETSVWKSD